MDISFCDRCQASIPRADVERGVTGGGGGLLLCAPCLAAERRRRAVTAVVLPVALLAAAAAGAAGAVAVLLPRLRAVEATVADLRAEEARRPAPDPGIAAELAGLRALAREQRDAVDGIRGDMERGLREVTRAMEAVAGQVGTLAGEILAVKGRVAGEAVPPAEPGPTAPPEPAAPPAPEPGPEIGVWLPLLDDDDPGVRLSALLALETARDARVAGKATEMLKDADPLVRAQAARMLGRGGDPSALRPVGALLSDPNVRVRAVAHEAVRALAGPVEGYDPTDPEDVREAAVKAWLAGRK